MAVSRNYRSFRKAETYSHRSSEMWGWFEPYDENLPWTIFYLVGNMNPLKWINWRVLIIQTCVLDDSPELYKIRHR
jgi:hypothetical protein